VAHEKAGENDDASHSFKLYLLAAPNAEDALAVNKRIGGLQYAAQKAEDAASVAAKKQADEQKAAVAAAEAELAWTDPNTGLMWAKKDNGYDIAQAQASDYCRNLNLADFRDWRLPTITELQSIYDDSHERPGWPNIKGDLQIFSWEWSSSPGNKKFLSAWAIGYDYSSQPGLREVPSGNSYAVRALCVRYAGK